MEKRLLLRCREKYSVGLEHLIEKVGGMVEESKGWRSLLDELSLAKWGKSENDPKC